MNATRLVLVIFLSPFLCFAQKDFLPGYIVTSSSDTIKGFVLESAPSLTSEKCYFRKDSLAEVQEFEPGQIKSFFFSNRLYRSKKIKFDNAKKVYFLECLFGGRLELYKFGRLEADYFFATQGDSTYALTNATGLSYSNGKRVQSSTRYYVGVLKWLMQVDLNFNQQIEKTDLEEKSLVRLFREYHSLICNGDCVYYEKKYPKQDKNRWRFGIGGSIQTVNNSLQIETLPSGAFRYLGQTTNSNSNIAKNSTKLVPAVQLLMSDLGGRTFVIEFKYLNYSDSEVKAEVINVPIAYQKQFLFAKKLTPYLLFGVAFNYNLAASFTGDRLINGIAVASRNFDWRGGEFSPFGGLGVSKNLINGHRIQLDVKYEFGPSISSGFSLQDNGQTYFFNSTLSTRTLLISLSYQLFQKK